MGEVEDTVDNGVAEMHIGTCHVNFGAQNGFSGLHTAGIHLVEQAEAFLYRTVTIGTGLPGDGGSALLGGDCFGGLLVDIGPAGLNAPQRKIPKFLEIVGGIDELRPFETEPFDVLLDGLDIFRVLFLGVGIVHAEITHPAVLLGYAKVDGYGLGVPDMEIAVGFGGETRL